MANLEKDIAEAVLKGSGLGPARLGLRFDRVVCRLLGDLRDYADSAAPEGLAVLLTITAPIRVPAKTVEALRGTIGAMLATQAPDAAYGATFRGNTVSLRLVKGVSGQRPKLVGFVHGPAADPNQLLDLAERWLSV